MSKILIMAEKPSVARALAAVLEEGKNRQGFIEGENYVFTWAIGHLAELADPEDYHPDLKAWKKETLPIIPQQFLLKPAATKQDHWKIVKSLLRSKFHCLINACDAGREGELIFRYIYMLAGSRLPVKRLWLKETTPAAIKKAMDNLEDASKYDNLAMAALARGQADWVVGINGTRAYTLAHKQPGQKGALSIGRVQTPTLALVVEREREIRNFVPDTWWEVTALFEADTGETYRGRWVDPEDNHKIQAKERAEEIARNVKHFRGNVEHIQTSKEQIPPPHLFSLGDLQKQANQKFGYSAAQTLEMAQRLYESRLITYPRTDSRYLTSDMSYTLPERLISLQKNPLYAGLVQPIVNNPKPAPGTVNDAGVSDHHAIVPTGDIGSIGRLTVDERNIYDLVVKSFIACFYPSAVISHSEILTLVKGERFFTSGKSIEEPGWMQVFNDEIEDSELQSGLPTLMEKTEVTTINTVPKQCKSQPPKRYTDASLISILENASRLVDEQSLKQALKKAKGIGTPATRAAIIERLITSGYMLRQGKGFAPTPLGEMIIDVVPEELRSLELTAAWEQKLSDIEQGVGSPAKFMKGIHSLTKTLVASASKNS